MLHVHDRVDKKLEQRITRLSWFGSRKRKGLSTDVRVDCLIIPAIEGHFATYFNKFLILPLQGFLTIRYIPFSGIFRCNDGTWITSDWICDVQNDCLGGEDEVDCTNAQYMETGQ